jgi:hypothetical protein
VHVPAERHKGPDALSRQPFTEEEIEALQAEDVDEDESFDMVLLQTASTDGHEAQDICESHDATLIRIFQYLQTEQPPMFAKPQQLRRFLQKAASFQIKLDILFCIAGNKAPHQVIMNLDKRCHLIAEAHDNFGHQGVHAVFHTMKTRFYWLCLYQDVVGYVKSCHQCQIQSTKHAAVTPSSPVSATIFSHIYLDVMDMPKSRDGHKYIVAACDRLTQAAEGRALKRITSVNIAKFIWEDILCRYGWVVQITTDNRSETKGACKELLEKYGVPQIRILPYNSRANGVVERGHFVLCGGIIKACQDNVADWPDFVPHAFFADKIMPRRATGASSFYLLHGIQPILPFDLTEVSFLVEGFHANMSPTELLALQIQQLAKQPEDIWRAAQLLKKMHCASRKQFERRYICKLWKTDFKPGKMVMAWNSHIEKSWDKKSQQHYLGPFEVVRKTKGGSYVLKELSGVIHQQGYAASRLLPYFIQSDQLLHHLGTSGSDDVEEQSEEEEESDEVGQA